MLQHNEVWYMHVCKQLKVYFLKSKKYFLFIRIHCTSFKVKTKNCRDVTKNYHKSLKRRMIKCGRRWLMYDVLLCHVLLPVVENCRTSKCVWHLHSDFEHLKLKLSHQVPVCNMLLMISLRVIGSSATRKTAIPRTGPCCFKGRFWKAAGFSPWARKHEKGCRYLNW